MVWTLTTLLAVWTLSQAVRAFALHVKGCGFDRTVVMSWELLHLCCNGELDWLNTLRDGTKS